MNDQERIAPQVQGLGDDERNQIYEAAKKADYHIAELQALPMGDLMAIARGEGLETIAGLNRQDLIFQILRRRATSTGLGWAEGVLDVLPDGFGFLRSRHYHYAAGPDDIYVSPSQIRRLNLKQGHHLAGPVRPPKEGEKYFALLHVEAVNDGTIEELRRRIPFDDLTPLLPRDRLRLEHPGCSADLRLIDFLAPIGRGQRVLLMTPPLSGRTRWLTDIAHALLTNHDDLYVILLLVDSRPEELTDVVRRSGPDHRREVVCATFDEAPARHIALSELVTERARRIVESGRHVVLLVDSLTQLVRAYNNELPHSGKIVTAGLDVVALQRPKRLFASARNIENGGSLTILATLLTDTGHRINDVIAEEFAGKANSEIVLDKHLSELHIVPPLSVARTGTRMEDNLLANDELQRVRALRRSIDGLDAAQSVEHLLQRIRQSADNHELLARAPS